MGGRGLAEVEIIKKGIRQGTEEHTRVLGGQANIYAYQVIRRQDGDL